MNRQCEVCASLGRRKAERKTRRLLIEERIVVLCEPHAERAEKARADTMGRLRLLFKEKKGQRSLVSRRSPVDRRLFPARPEGRRLGAGRRATDSDSD